MKRSALALLIIGLIMVFSASGALAVNKGGTFNWIAPYGSNVATLDPNMAHDEQDNLVTINIHRGLYKWDGATSVPVLELADSVDVSEDGLVYTYHLKKNVKFHNGRQLVADDIIYTYERIMNPKNVMGASDFIRPIKGAAAKRDGKADKIEGLKKIDDFTLEITLENPIDPGYMLWQPSTAIVPKEEAEKPDFASNPVGCGPFKFVKWVKGSEIVLEKFDDFYEEGKPYLDKLVYKIMGESAARDMAFKAQELDAVIVYSSMYVEYRKDPELSKRLLETAEMFTRMIAFNRDFALPDGRKPFSDVRVRQAFNYAIDSNLIIEKYLKGKAYPAVGFLPPTSAAFDPKAKGYEYDLEKAKALMKEAGYEDGFPLEIVGTSSSSYGTGVVEVIIPFLKKINIEVKPITLEGAAKYDRQRKGDFQAIIGSLDSGPDPLQALWRFHSSTPQAGRNTPNYNNPEFDKLLEQAAKMVNGGEEKLALIRKADAIFREDAPIWFFNYNKAIIAYQPWVHGLEPSAPEMMYQDFTDVWVDENSPRAK